MPPGKNVDGLWTIIRSGMWRLYYKLSSEGRKRFYNEFMPLLHDTKHDVMGKRDDNSYYLVYLGSKPSARGKGYARKLIEHMTSQVRPSRQKSSDPFPQLLLDYSPTPFSSPRTLLEITKDFWKTVNAKSVFSNM